MEASLPAMANSSTFSQTKTTLRRVCAGLSGWGDSVATASAIRPPCSKCRVKSRARRTNTSRGKTSIHGGIPWTGSTSSFVWCRCPPKAEPNRHLRLRPHTFFADSGLRLSVDQPRRGTFSIANSPPFATSPPQRGERDGCRDFPGGGS